MACHWSKLLLWAETRIQIFESAVMLGAELHHFCYTNCNVIERRNAVKGVLSEDSKTLYLVQGLYRTRREVKYELRVINLKDAVVD